MWDKKKIEESSKTIQQLIKEGKIVKADPKLVPFFIQKSQETLVIAERLHKIQQEEKIKANVWIINTSYYAMFFAATALLAKFDHRIKTEIGIHKLTYHALVYYFVKQESKLKRQIVEEYNEAINEAEELLQRGEEKIKELLQDYNYELGKRKIFTYEMVDDSEESKANTSLQRAKRFFREVERLLSSK